MDLLASFRAKGGTVILVSHDPEWVLSYADHIMLLDSHHLVGQYVQADFTDIATLLLNGGIQDEAI
jgi:ABC-type Mn2+/Zn2+ transport system ATPase subunit